MQKALTRTKDGNKRKRPRAQATKQAAPAMPRVSTAPAVAPQPRPLTNLGASPVTLAAQSFQRDARNAASPNAPFDPAAPPEFPANPKADAQVQSLQASASAANTQAARHRQDRTQAYNAISAVHQAQNPEQPPLTAAQLQGAGMTAGQYRAISGLRPDYTGYLASQGVTPGQRAQTTGRPAPLSGRPITPSYAGGQEVPRETLDAATVKLTEATPEQLARHEARRDQRVRQGRDYANRRRDQAVQGRLDQGQDKVSKLPAGTTEQRRRDDALREDQQSHERQAMATAISGRGGSSDRQRALSNLRDHQVEQFETASRAYDTAARRYHDLLSNSRIDQDGEDVSRARREMNEAKDARDAAQRKVAGQEMEMVAQTIPSGLVDNLRQYHAAAMDPAQHAQIKAQFGLNPDAEYTPEDLQMMINSHFDALAGTAGLSEYLLGI